jgi:hypothetical protein
MGKARIAAAGPLTSATTAPTSSGHLPGAVLLLDRAGWHTTGRVAVPQLNRAAGGRGSGPARLAGSIASVEKRALTASGAPRRA